MNSEPYFPRTRLRRNRNAPWIRDITQEHRLSAKDFIYPMFVIEGVDIRQEIPSMPDVHRFSIDELICEVKEAYAIGIPAIALFPAIAQDLKTVDGKEAFNPDNLVCRAIRAIKQAIPDIGVIADVALDPYTSHGHDGVLNETFTDVDNDKTLESLKKQALILAKAGCDYVAPSDMMDGRIGMIRDYLDSAGYTQTGIISYAVKYASAFYGPFRDAVGSAANLAGGSKKTYQMNPANSLEALREVSLDVAEGADIIMVKPAMAYLDIIAKIRQNFSIPLFAYQVSGEYAMIKSASVNNWLNEKDVVLETLIGFKRAGCDAIFTYYAKQAALWLQEEQ